MFTNLEWYYAGVYSKGEQNSASLKEMEVVKYHKALIITILIEQNLPEHCPLCPPGVSRSDPDCRGRSPGIRSCSIWRSCSGFDFILNMNLGSWVDDQITSAGIGFPISKLNRWTGFPISKLDRSFRNLNKKVHEHCNGGLQKQNGNRRECY